MKTNVRAMALGIACLMPPAAKASETIKVGLLTTLSGPGGIIGRHQRDGAALALSELGGKLGGRPAEIIVGDDQAKPDVGRQIVDGMLKRDKVQFVTGVVFSNVLLAVHRPIVAARAVLVSASGGPSELAGRHCSPDFFSVSWQNDQAAEAMGTLLNEQAKDTAVIMAPNYAAGKDMLAGFGRKYKGNILAEIFTNFSQVDYQAELSRIRSLAPKAVFIFYPGGLGIQFVKQFAQAGLKGKIPLYSVYTQNETTLPAMGADADGNFEVGPWSPDLPVSTNKSFVADFKKRYGYSPSEYAASSFDAVNLINGAADALHGDFGDKAAVTASLAKAPFRSVRGNFTFNNNHFPVQDFYLFQIGRAAGSEEEVREMKRVVVSSYGDAYANDCPLK